MLRVWKVLGWSTWRIFRIQKALGGSACCFLRVWKALGGAICSILRVWKALGGSICCILRVWNALGGSICCILYAARRPADPVKSCPCFILRRFLPRASYLDICFCAPKGLIAPIGASRLRRSLTARLRRDGLIPKKTYRWPCFTLPLHLPGALLFARPKGALRLSARLIGGGC